MRMSLTAPPPLRQQHNHSDELDLSLGGLPGNGGDDSFVFDLTQLQDAIDEIRMSNSDSWKDKARALNRVQQHFVRQQTMNQRTADELNAVEEQLRLLEGEYTHELEKLTSEAEKERRRADNLAHQLKIATQDNTSYEKVAEQAVSSIEGLHQEMISLKADLKKREVESEKLLDEYHAVLEANATLTGKLDAVERQASHVSVAHGEAEATIRDLEAKVNALTEEKTRLMQERNNDHLEMDGLRLESENLADAESRLRSKEAEVDRLMQANDDLSATVFEQQKALAQQVEKREADIQTMNLKIQTLMSELSSSKRRLEDAANDQRNFRKATQEEQSSLREKLRQVESERDRLHDLRDADLSEMETLKLESAMRADLEKRLKAAASEIDRLRVARSKVHDEMALVRAEAATRVDDKDNIIQQLKLELHQAKIEVTSLRRRLGDAEDDNERIRRMSEEEHQRSAAKLSAATERLSHLQSELSESVRVRSISENEVIELKVAIQAREDEISNIKAQLDRVKMEQAEGKEVNKKLRESLYDLRDKARAQVMGIAEKKREIDLSLENEREKSAALMTENSRLSESLEKLRREHELDRDGLGTFKDDLAKLLKEKSEALNHAARLEKQLQEIELKAEDLEHELEISKMKSNEDLLRKAKEEYRSAQSSNARLTEAIHGLTAERDGLVHDIEILRRQLDKFQKSKVASETNAANLETMLEQSKHTIEDLEHQLKIAALRSNGEPLKKAREENRAHQKKVAELQLALERAHGERDEYHRALKERDVEIEKYDDARKKLQNYIGKLENSKKELESHVSTMMSKLRITEHNSNDLRQELETTIQRREELERAYTNVREELEATVQKQRELEEIHENNTQALRREMEVLTRQQEEERRARADSDTVRVLEQEIESLRYQISTRPSEGVSLAELRVERERYDEAAHLIATLAQRAKASTEHRDRIIRKLKSNLTQVSEQKEAEIQALRARLHEWERSIVRDEEYQWRSDNHHF